MSTNHPRNRWYDRDPALSKALEQLKNAPDKYQAQVALNIIKIIVEHQMEEEINVSADNLNEILARGSYHTEHNGHRRWYDVHETLGSAMQLLKDCPDDLQARVVPSISEMIEDTLNNQEVC